MKVGSSQTFIAFRGPILGLYSSAGNTFALFMSSQLLFYFHFNLLEKAELALLRYAYLGSVPSIRCVVTEKSTAVS